MHRFAWTRKIDGNRLIPKSPFWYQSSPFDTFVRFNKTGSPHMRSAGRPSIWSIAARFIVQAADGCRDVIGLSVFRRFSALVMVSVLACLCSPAFGQRGPIGGPGRGPGNPTFGQPPFQPPFGGPHRPGNVPPMIPPASGNAMPPIGLQFGRALMAGTNAAILNGMAPAQIDAALGYRPDPQISAQVRANSIANASASNPALRPTLEQTFNDTGLRALDRKSVV